MSRTLLLLLLAPGACHQPFSQERGDIAALAETAKVQGLVTIAVPGRTIIEYLTAPSLEVVLKAGFSPFLVEIVRKRSSVTGDGNQILTWYEARVLEAFDHRPLPGRVLSDRGFIPPPEMRAVPKSSFLLLNHGGNARVDGVLITSPERPLTLLPGGTYLVFVRLTTTRTELSVAPASVRRQRHL